MRSLPEIDPAWQDVLPERRPTPTTMPKGWKTGHGGDVACPHRDCSCCPDCAKREEVVEVYGQHFWEPSAIARFDLLKSMAAA
jgi:hypothetical protein